MLSLTCKYNPTRLLHPIYIPFLLVQVAFGIRQLQSVFSSADKQGHATKVFVLFRASLWPLRCVPCYHCDTSSRRKVAFRGSFSDPVSSGGTVQSSWNLVSLVKLLWEVQIGDTPGLMNSYLLFPPGEILSYMFSGAWFQEIKWQKNNLIETIFSCSWQICSVCIRLIVL